MTIQPDKRIKFNTEGNMGALKKSKKWKKKKGGRPASPNANVVRIPTYVPPPPFDFNTSVAEAEAYAAKRWAALRDHLKLGPAPVLVVDESKPDPYGDVAKMAKEILEGGGELPEIIIRPINRPLPDAGAILAALDVGPHPDCGDDYPKPKKRRRFPIPR